jgi:hypothetical protein
MKYLFRYDRRLSSFRRTSNNTSLSYLVLSVTSNGIPNNDEFRFHGNVIKVTAISEITFSVFASNFFTSC